MSQQHRRPLATHPCHYWWVYGWYSTPVVVFPLSPSLEMMHKNITWVPVKVFVFILSDPELLQMQLSVILLIKIHHLKSVVFLSRHPDHNYCLQGRATDMARAAASALQPAQLRGLQHLWGLHLPQSTSIPLLLCKAALPLSLMCSTVIQLFWLHSSLNKI